MRHALAAVLLLCAAAAFAGTSATPPSTTNNDDSCDIAMQPAATLLMPYFDVDFRALQSSATTALFTIQNLSPAPRIANVTLWTDWGFPAFNFPIQLTGYGVQGINLYDLFTRGAIPPTECSAAAVSSSLLTDLQLMFTTGRGTGAGVPCTALVGNVHRFALGYVTIDLVSACAAKNALASDYFASLLYDNVLTGDYQQLETAPGGHVYASGGPLVHIRAIPEGGAAGAVVATSLPYTFYDRFTPSMAMRKTDRRQPLPSLFAPRFINGGTGAFNTTLKIWREGITVGACSGAGIAAVSNSNMDVADRVRFDEHENATVIPPGPGLGAPCPACGPPGLPPTSPPSTASTSVFPPFSTSGDLGGWLYLNLDNGRMSGRPSQNWVITSMYAAPTYATEATVTVLGNGCSPAVKAGVQIAPSP
jgi:hypothetical protein